MLILSYEDEFNLHVNEISFSYERMSTKTRIEEEAKDHSEMAYSVRIIKTMTSYKTKDLCTSYDNIKLKQGRVHTCALTKHNMYAHIKDLH